MMDTKSYTTLDRSGWGSGIWDGEPDKVQWPDAVTGLPCLAVRTVMGHWCGYVGVTAPHPLYEIQCRDCPNLNVHGGITFAAACDFGADESHSICHLPGPGESDRVWWLGFDCAHAFDHIPGHMAMLTGLGFDYINRDAVYRTLAYVQENCADLAKQLIELEMQDV